MMYLRSFKIGLLLSVSTLSIFSGSAWAAHRPLDKKKHPTIHAQNTPASTSRAPRKNFAHAGIFIPKQAEQLQVTGHHYSFGGGLLVRHTEPKAVSTVTQAYIAKQSPILSPTLLAASLPGVQANNEGPMSTQAETLHIRGLDSTQIGFVYENMPAADPFSYSPYTETMVDNENIASISVSQGSSDLTAPTYNADGAQMSVSLRHPEKKFGAYVEGSYGSYNTNKAFVRVDTGEIGHSGVYGFASFSRSTGNLWRGPGTMYRYHLDSSLEKSWGAHSYSRLIFSWTAGKQNEWLYPSLAAWHQYGINFTIHPGFTYGDALSYNINTKETNAFAGTIRNHFDLGHGLALDLQPYSVETNGPNTYGTNIPMSGYIGLQHYTHVDGYLPGKGIIATASVHPWRQASSGVIVTGSWTKGINTLQLSGWYNYVSHYENEFPYPLDAQGGTSIRGGYLTAGGKEITQYDINGFQQLTSLTLDDKLNLLSGKLTLDAGLRTVFFQRTVSERLIGADPYKSVRNLFIPTPQFLASYQLDAANQVYINGTTGYRAPSTYASQVQVFSLTAPQPVSQPLSNYRNEYMIGEEIGYRHYGPVSVTLAAFNYNLTHHQISSSSYIPGTAIMISQPIDAGGEQAQGIQAELATRPWHYVSAYASGQYMHTRIGNNIAYQGDFVPSKRRQGVASPRWIGALGLTYDDDTNFMNFNLRYSDSQYGTLMNDQGIPAYFTADASIGRYLPRFAHIRPKALLTLTNLGNVHYLSGVTGFSAASTSTHGVYGKMLSGAQPAYIVGSGFSAIGTIALDFN